MWDVCIIGGALLIFFAIGRWCGFRDGFRGGYAKAVADWEERRAAYDPPALPLEECKVPPKGWRCTRPAGHEGPCAAVPEAETGAVDAEVE
jgi:hypothetical protein